MTVCPRCHNANLVKTILGRCKCPQCLYERDRGGPPEILKPERYGGDPDPDRKRQWQVHAMHEEYCKRRKGEVRKGRVAYHKKREEAGKKREQENTRVFPQYLQEDTTELIKIITLRKTARIAQLAAIRALGEKGDPQVLELLSSFGDHPDMDFRRYARRAIESINSQQVKQNIIQSRTPVDETE